mmetsp:Transcript_85462/g.169565  ORF Transcript_85462/g.169565 Transcript_85462/m.169565 type:complete len:436 (-) Transcript_85462:44-1351(-)
MTPHDAVFPSVRPLPRFVIEHRRPSPHVTIRFRPISAAAQPPLVGLGGGILAAGWQWPMKRRGSQKRQRSERPCTCNDKESALTEVSVGTESQPLDAADWVAVFINLKRRSDRRAKLMHLLSFANGPLLRHLQRIDAVDARRLAFSDKMVKNNVEHCARARARRSHDLQLCTIVHNGDGQLVNFDDHLTLGAIACALSHRKALQKIASHPTAKWGLVLEDDVNAAVPRVDLTIAGILHKLPHDWDAVCLGYHHAIGKVHPMALATTGCMGMCMSGLNVRVLPARGPVYGLGAWMVRKEAAEALLQWAFPISRQVDYTLTSSLYRWNHKLFVVNEESMLFYAPSSEEGMDSDVQTMVSLDKVMKQHKSLAAYKTSLNGRSRWSHFLYGEHYGDSDSDETEDYEMTKWCQEEQLWYDFEQEQRKRRRRCRSKSVRHF